MIYIIPRYIDGIGNGTLIRNEDGIKELNISIDSALKKVFEEKSIDLRVVKRKTSRLLDQRNLIPLYLAYDDVLVPIRIRKPLVKGDNVYGYINLNLVKKVEDGRVIFIDGSSIDYIESKKTIKRRMKIAEKIRDKFGERDTLKALTEIDINLPATKEDILILMREVMRIKDIIEGLNSI